jgi:hypothetical protein
VGDRDVRGAHKWRNRKGGGIGGEPDDGGGNAPTPLEVGIYQRVELWHKPPYNAEWEQRSEAARQESAPPRPQQVLKSCSYIGFPAVMEWPTPDRMFQIVVTPQETLLLFPDGEVRQIYTDGRTHPASRDLWPTPMGDSIGYWKSATLLIDTIARKAGPILAAPIPGIANLSDQTHYTEVLRLLDADTLENDMTINDPERFAHPWRISIRYKRVKDVDRLIFTNCSENDRDTIVNGKPTIAPP